MNKSLAAIAIRYGLIPLGHNLIRAYLSLIRFKVINEEALIAYLRGNKKVIAAFWHQRIFGVIGYAGRFAEYSPSLMISASRDGELIAQLVSRLNFRPVRGSSTRGGKEALAAMVADLTEHNFAAHASDGPGGPPGVLKAGLIRMAQLTGAAIFPLYISCSRAWRLKSWDRFLIPKPFSQIVIRWSNPISIPQLESPEAFEKARRYLEEQMRVNQTLDDQLFGWQDLLLEGSEHRDFAERPG